MKYAQLGIALGQSLNEHGSPEAKRLEQLAFLYSTVGSLDLAVSSACLGIEEEDSRLPRQDFRLVEALKHLSLYCKEMHKPELGNAAMVRANAIDRRLRVYEKIFQ